MEDKSRGWLFRKRNVLGAALVAGVVVGIYLPDFWKGFGGGSSVGVGIGDPVATTSGEPGQVKEAKPAEEPVVLTDVPPVIKVVIDDRSYFLRSNEGDQQVKIPQIIELVKAAAGDADGIRVRVYRKGSSRASAENDLQDAFVGAGIKDTAVVWIPVAVD